MIKHITSNYIQKKFIKKAEMDVLMFKNMLVIQDAVKSLPTYRYLMYELQLLVSKFSARSRSRNICVLTGRTKGVYRKTFRLTRMQIREKGSVGLIPGVRKASW